MELGKATVPNEGFKGNASQTERQMAGRVSSHYEIDGNEDNDNMEMVTLKSLQIQIDSLVPLFFIYLIHIVLILLLFFYIFFGGGGHKFGVQVKNDFKKTVLNNGESVWLAEAAASNSLQTSSLRFEVK